MSQIIDWVKCGWLGIYDQKKNMFVIVSRFKTAIVVFIFIISQKNIFIWHKIAINQLGGLWVTLEIMRQISRK